MSKEDKLLVAGLRYDLMVGEGVYDTSFKGHRCYYVIDKEDLVRFAEGTDYYKALHEYRLLELVHEKGGYPKPSFPFVYAEQENEENEFFIPE